MKNCLAVGIADPAKNVLSYYVARKTQRTKAALFMAQLQSGIKKAIRLSKSGASLVFWVFFDCIRLHRSSSKMQKHAKRQ